MKPAYRPRNARTIPEDGILYRGHVIQQAPRGQVYIDKGSERVWFDGLADAIAKIDASLRSDLFEPPRNDYEGPMPEEKTEDKAQC